MLLLTRTNRPKSTVLFPMNEREICVGDLDLVMSFAERILECPMVVIEGVAETLEYLAKRHDLTLFTKGHRTAPSTRGWLTSGASIRSGRG